MRSERAEPVRRSTVSQALAELRVALLRERQAERVGKNLVLDGRSVTGGQYTVEILFVSCYRFFFFFFFLSNKRAGK